MTGHHLKIDRAILRHLPAAAIVIGMSFATSVFAQFVQPGPALRAEGLPQKRTVTAEPLTDVPPPETPKPKEGAPGATVAAEPAEPVKKANDTPLDAAALQQLLDQLSARDAATRETVVRRLSPHADQARAPVVERFRSGNLTSRLAALELLSAWQAPIAGLDPWQKDTLTSARLQALQTWASAPLQADKKIAEPSKADRANMLSELDRLLKVPPAELPAILERLAGFGEVISREVAKRLKASDREDDRQRLTALRYRLVAGDDLATRWPGGLMRLAARDAAERRKATQEFVDIATAADEALLLQLFSDGDPLVRELTLKTLRKIGGRRAIAALTKLLADPEPNVRAAVLKQLAEKPSDELAVKVAEYLRTETDADLLVHGVRVLKEAGGDAAIAQLVELTRHDSWQVRAEAVEALSKLVGRHSDKLPDNIRTAIEARLGDTDEFVIGRALKLLQSGSALPPPDRLLELAEKHPDLTLTVVKSLGQTVSSNGPEQVRKFLNSSKPEVRVAAMTALLDEPADLAAADLDRTLGDPESAVRLGVATAVFKWLDNRGENVHRQTTSQATEFRVTESYLQSAPTPSLTSRIISSIFGVKKSDVVQTKKIPADAEPADDAKPDDAKPAADAQPAGDLKQQDKTEKQSAEAAAAVAAGKTQPAADDVSQYDHWLASYQSGAGRPAWADKIMPRLTAMTKAETPAERSAAALLQLALGQRGESLDILKAASRANSDLAEKSAFAFPWLPYDQRRDLFEDLWKLAEKRPANFAELVSGLGSIKDARNDELFWTHLHRQEVPNDAFAAFYYALQDENHRYSSDQVSPIAPKKLADLQSRIAAGGEQEKRLALLLIVSQDFEAAATEANKVLADEHSSQQLQAFAFQVLLCSQTQSAGESSAAKSLASPNAARRQLAIGLLVNGVDAVERFTEYGIYVSAHASAERSRSFDDNLPIRVPPRPKYLTLEAVRPLLQDPDPDVSAMAGYLLCSLGDSSGLPLLIKRWEDAPDDPHRWDVLVFRAIAVLDDDRQLPVLERLYHQYAENSSAISEFYWTIRLMKGPQILQFRAKIRREVGVNNLKQ